MSPARQEILARLRAARGSREWVHGVDLHGEALAHEVLVDVRLERFNFSAAVLRGADLGGMQGVDGECIGADLTGARLEKCVFHDCVFSNAKLVAANGQQMVMAVCFCIGTDLSECDLTNAVLDGTVFDRASFRGAILANASAVDAIFAGADLSGADLSGAKLCGADFRNARLDGARFTGADLEGALFDAPLRP